MSEEQKEMQVEAAEKAAKKVAPVTTAEPEENFDWDAYENDAVVPASEKDALTQKYAETLSKVGEKEVVEGTVISMNKREVVVNIGYTKAATLYTEMKGTTLYTPEAETTLYSAALIMTLFTVKMETI